LWLRQFSRAVAFDRKGTGSIITHQFCGRTCSDEFAADLAEKLAAAGLAGYKKDSGGTFTDTANYADVIPECTNVSVGYELEHTKEETLDLHHVVALAAAVVAIDWEALVTKRDPAVDDEYEDDDFGWFRGWEKRKAKKHKSKWKKHALLEVDADEDLDFGYGAYDSIYDRMGTTQLTTEEIDDEVERLTHGTPTFDPGYLIYVDPQAAAELIEDLSLRVEDLEWYREQAERRCEDLEKELEDLEAKLAKLAPKTKAPVTPLGSGAQVPAVFRRRAVNA